MPLREGHELARPASGNHPGSLIPVFSATKSLLCNYEIPFFRYKNPIKQSVDGGPRPGRFLVTG
jgi:hypothetical protein